MINKALAVAAVLLALAGAFWAYGNARYDAGRDDQAAEQGTADAQRSQEMAAARRQSAELLGRLEARLNNERRLYDEMVRARLLADESYLAWYKARPHPVAAEFIYGMHDDAGADRDGVPGRREPDSGD